jgi:hypothetical protein
VETHQRKPLTQPVSDVRQVRLLYLLCALVVAAVAAPLAAWLLTRSSESKVVVPTTGGPTAVSEAQLKALAKTTDHAVYWAGPKSGIYELTRTADGRIYVRYLPSAERIGDRAPKYLTVGTYPQRNAFRSIQRAARRPGAISLKIGDGGLMVFNERTPKSVYFGYRGSNYQVEVYDPSPQQARTLVLAGQIKPIE